MKIQAISNAVAHVGTNAYKNTTVPQSLQPVQPIQKEAQKQKDNSPQALMNYFLGMQNVPSFKGYPCSTSAFVVKQINDVPCACCGKEMMNAKEQNDFVAKAVKARGEELAEVLNSNMHKFRRNERPVARMIMEDSVKKPNDSISGLLSKSNITARDLYKKECVIVLDNVSNQAKELYGEKNKVSSFVDGQKLLFNSNSRKSFSRQDFLKNIQNITVGDEEKTNKLLDTAIEIPLGEKGIQNVLKKFKGADSTSVARRLISTAVQTTEHIQPKSLGGPNNTENYMGECAECNNNRGSQNLNNYWQTFYPNMPHSVQRYNDFITEKIIKGEMGVKYEDYPLDLEKAVEKETKGVIDLKVLNPEQIDKIRKEKGYADPTPLPEPVKTEKPENTKKPSGVKKPNRKPSRR